MLCHECVGCCVMSVWHVVSLVFGVLCLSFECVEYLCMSVWIVDV